MRSDRWNSNLIGPLSLSEEEMPGLPHRGKATRAHREKAAVGKPRRKL